MKRRSFWNTRKRKRIQKTSLRGQTIQIESLSFSGLMKSNYLLLLLAFSTLFLFGCIKKATFTSYLSAETIEYQQKEVKEVNTCTALICDYKEASIFTKIWDSLVSMFTSEKKIGVASLAGGNCSLKKFDLTQSTQKSALEAIINSGSNTMKSTGTFIQTVMIGTGDSVFVGEEFKSLCGGNLGFIILKLESQKVDASEVEFLSDCILSSGTIPFYKYNYLEYPSLLAEAANKKGAAFIAPGFGYSIKRSLNTENVRSPSGTFSSIKSWCPKCLTVAVVRFNDTETLDFYKASGDMDSIDVVGFTVDVNSFESCEPNIILYSKEYDADSNVKKDSSIKAFAQHVIETYGKPTMILDIDVRQGTNQKETCTWTNTTIGDFYQALIKSISALSRSGVIGISIKDISSLPKEGLNSLGLFCTIYYSSSSPTSTYSSFAVFSEAGDNVASQCNQYGYNNDILDLEVTDYNKINLQKTVSTTQCGNLFCIDMQSVLPGSFDAGYCMQNSLFIKNMASENKIDASVLMAALAYKGQYDSGGIPARELFLSNPHCSCDTYEGIQKNICCVAQTLGYYENKAKNSFPNDSLVRAYLSLYGIVSGDNGFNGEISNRIYNEYYMPNPFVEGLLSNAKSVRTVCGIC